MAIVPKCRKPPWKHTPSSPPWGRRTSGFSGGSWARLAESFGLTPEESALAIEKDARTAPSRPIFESGLTPEQRHGPRPRQAPRRGRRDVSGAFTIQSWRRFTRS
ncbi:MAG: hypothetical protein MZV63_25995 [Marinilabiliales bacterium]|nr:hypothetical protein [Marinilabiliales bacterium]